MKVTMTVKQAKALVSLVEIDDTRWFANVVHVTSEGVAVVSDSYNLIKVQVIVEDWEKDTHIKGSALATSLKVAVAKKETMVTVETDKDNVMHGIYPPVESAFPGANRELIGQFNVDLLIKSLQAVKAAHTDKRKLVKIYRNKSYGMCRPFEIEAVQDSPLTTLVVPSKL